MDWAKVDAPLAAALVDAGDDEAIPVFVHLDPGVEDVPGFPEGQAGLRTTTLSAAEVAALTDHPAVIQIRLSTALRPIADP